MSIVGILFAVAGCRHSEPPADDSAPACAAERAWWQDLDADGFGAAGTAVQACDAPAGFVDNQSDCDDGAAGVHPGTTDDCNQIDDDCDGITDPTATEWFADVDEDGFGDPASSLRACEAPVGFLPVAADCDDLDPDRNPDAPERCNGLDDNCDGTTDDSFDFDGDGHVSPTCPGGDDCNDDDITIFPGAPEVCEDGIDQDCAGGDPVCRFEGSHELASAFAKYHSDGANYAVGFKVEAGDIDGDGNEDLVTGAYYAHNYNGGAYVVAGPPSGTHALGDVGSFIEGESAQNEGGRAIGVADANDDGYDDVLLGAPESSSDEVAVVFGPIDGDVLWSDADVLGDCEHHTNECGHGVDLGDVNGDGFADAVTSAGEDDDNGYNAGALFVNYGPLDDTSIDIESESDCKILGAEANLETGRYVRAGGDLDGDGVGDLMATATYDSTGGASAGAVYVVLGPPAATMDLSVDADAILVGESPGDTAGEGIAMGDADDDGYADAIVASTYHDAAKGAAYVIPGLDVNGTIDLGTAPFIVRGETTSQSVGTGLDARNGALLVGAPGDASGGMRAGAAYVFYAPLSGTLAASEAHASFAGESNNDMAGSGVAFVDRDSDGLDELAIGAVGENAGGMNGGSVYLVVPE